MEHELPKDVAHLMDFLVLHGFDLVKRTQSKYFGNVNIILENENILISIHSDRSIWNITIKDKNYHENKSYDIPIIYHIVNENCDDVMSMSDQIEFLTMNLDFIFNIFNKNNSFTTHCQLALLMKERVKRRFPNLHFPQT